MTETSTVSWTAPGPGPWEAEGTHFPKPIPRFGRAGIRRAFMSGFAEGTARYGLLLSHFEVEFVNGFWYQQPAAFGAPKGAKGPPPGPVLWLLTRLHPGMRARIRASRDAFANKVWREDLRRWDEVDKPAALKRHATLLAVDLAVCDDETLATHLREVDAHTEAMVGLHHKYTIPCILPVGNLMAHVADWTGESPSSILEMLRGSTPISRGILAEELTALASAVRGDARARELLTSSDAAGAIAELCALPGDVGSAARVFFDAIAHRAVGYEISSKSAGEMPEMLLGAVRATVSGVANDERGNSASRIQAIRKKVPAAHHGTFDEMLEEARVINRLRDERGIYADGFAIGIARRALLETGRRLTARGLLAHPEHAVDLEVDEAVALLLGRPGPSADEVAARVTWRTTKTVADIPADLGGMPGPPPDPNLLPAPARRAARAIDAVLSNLFREAETTSTATVIRGLSVNEGVYEGTARLIEDASQFERLQKGDVLVTRATAPYFNVVLPLLGAIVTDRGGQLCHAAIVSREYGIPGVVGTKEATRLIPDGARVRVDGTKGEVVVLSAVGS